MRKTPSIKTPAAESPDLDLFPAPAKRAPRRVPVKASVPKAAPVPAVASRKPAPAKALLAKAAPAKAAPAKTAKTIPVRAVSLPPAPVRVVAETPATYFTGAGGRAWRMSGKHAVAYVGDAALAGELLATEPRHLAKSAMAVYYDRKGKPFAWQLRFDTARWEDVVKRLA
jgi:hypothetical protein